MIATPSFELAPSDRLMDNRGDDVLAARMAPGVLNEAH